MAQNPPTSPKPKSGGLLSQGFTVAGHKVSWAAIGGLAAIVGIVLVLRARSSGGTVVGTPASAATLAAQQAIGQSTIANSQIPDYSAQLDNLQQGLGTLQQSLQPPANAPASINVSPPAGWSKQVAVLSQPAASTTNWGQFEEGTIAAGTLETGAGAPVEGPAFSYQGVTSNIWQPIKWNGGTGYIWAPNSSA